MNISIISENAVIVKTTFVCFIFIAFRIFLISTRQIEFPISEMLFILTHNTLICIYGLTCLRIIRGKTYESKKVPYNQLPFGIWSYVWRLIITLIISVLIVAGFLLVTGIRATDTHSIQFTLMFSLAILFVLPTICWAIFSSDRKGQMQWCIVVVRGY
ncbi:MAG: hypothetical protein COA86_15105 [Kangiella sp.]|nr:MAG: hypothetical protein COA86_15105 [Kangiella sp.]